MNLLLIILLILYIVINNLTLLFFVLGLRRFTKPMTGIDVIKILVFGSVFVFLHSEQK